MRAEIYQIDNIPFGRLAMVGGEMATVPSDADGDTLESCRRALEGALNRTTARAYALVDRRTHEGTIG